MNIVKFPKDVMYQVLYRDHPTAKIIRNEMYDTSRWSIYYELIFELDGKLYQTTYSRGATECQDEQPWEYGSDVECTEVEEYETVIKDYRPVEVAA